MVVIFFSDRSKEISVKMTF